VVLGINLSIAGVFIDEPACGVDGKNGDKSSLCVKMIYSAIMNETS
jgi:hypothetical protein